MYNINPNHISDETQDLIKSRAAADIVGIVGRYVALRRSGKDYEGLCPFHQDNHLGNFKVSPSKGICKCFAGCGTYDAIAFVRKMEGCSYTDALRMIAGWENVWIDEPTASISKRIKTMQHNRELTPVAEPQILPTIIFPKEMVRSKLAQKAADPGNFVTWLRSLNWTEDERKSVEIWLELYQVGVSDMGQTKGWTIWWQIDERLQVHTGKMMAYKPDGHRDKMCNPYQKDGVTKYYTFNWIHSLLEQSGWWDSKKAEMRQCLFGLHMVDAFKDAEICIVESEKSAVIAQCTVTPGKRLFLACGGLENLNTRMLQPLIERQRWIILYPDIDGYEKWEKKMHDIDYPRITISQKVRELWRPCDGRKADIADILVRLIQGTEQPSDAVEQQCGFPLSEAAKELINKLDLRIIPQTHE